ncbi:MAG: hypothetical protein ABH883_05300, partial [Candidatus Omnitrophota bacterium]
ASFLFSTLLPAEARDINIESPALGIQSPFQRAMLGAGIDVPSCVFDKSTSPPLIGEPRRWFILESEFNFSLEYIMKEFRDNPGIKAMSRMKINTALTEHASPRKRLITFTSNPSRDNSGKIDTAVSIDLQDKSPVKLNISFTPCSLQELTYGNNLNVSRVNDTEGKTTTPDTAYEEDFTVPEGKIDISSLSENQKKQLADKFLRFEIIPVWGENLDTEMFLALLKREKELKDAGYKTLPTEAWGEEMDPEIVSAAVEYNAKTSKSISDYDIHPAEKIFIRSVINAVEKSGIFSENVISILRKTFFFKEPTTNFNNMLSPLILIKKNKTVLINYKESTKSTYTEYYDNIEDYYDLLSFSHLITGILIDLQLKIFASKDKYNIDYNNFLLSFFSGKFYAAHFDKNISPKWEEYQSLACEIREVLNTTKSFCLFWTAFEKSDIFSALRSYEKLGAVTQDHYFHKYLEKLESENDFRARAILQEIRKTNKDSESTITRKIPNHHSSISHLCLKVQQRKSRPNNLNGTLKK